MWTSFLSGTESCDIKRMTELKDNQHDTATYNEMKQYLIAKHRCPIFKKGAKVFITGENLIAGYIFRERGSAYYYATYSNAIQ